MMMTEDEFVDYVKCLQRKFPPNCVYDSGPWYITDHVFLGRLDNARNIGLMYQLGINCLLYCAANHNSRPIYAKSTKMYACFMAKDVLDYPIERHFKEAMQFLQDCKLENTNNKVMVYCRQGINRSVTICVLYLVVYRSMSLVDAVMRMFRIKQNILSNAGFVRCLYRYCKRHGYPIQTLE